MFFSHISYSTLDKLKFYDVNSWAKKPTHSKKTQPYKRNNKKTTKNITKQYFNTTKLKTNCTTNLLLLLFH